MHTILLAAALAAAQPQSASLHDALTIGRTQDQAVFDAFVAGYQLPVSGSIERAEVITEFRRAVMIVRDHVRQGEYGLTERDLAAELAPYRGLVTIVVQIRLHPLNTLVKPPAYNLYISTGPRSGPLAPRQFSREPIYPMAVPAPGTSLTAVRLEGTFTVADIAGALDPHLVVLDESGEPMWNVRLDLSRFR